MTSDPLRLFLERHAAASRLIYTTQDVQATFYRLQDGTDVVLKVTSPDRTDFESNQVSNEVKAARSLPDCSSLGHHVAWKDGADGSMLSVSLYAGCSVETLLQLPAAKGGWADLDLQQRVEVARDVLAGGVLALIKMRPWLHFDVKPGNLAVMPCPANGPPHVTLLDMGAATHIAALHAPQRGTLYPVVSRDHMDVTLITRQPGQEEWPYESKQGAREALSDKTDIFTLGLLAYKILLGSQLPPEMDWESTLYEPWGEAQEVDYIAAQQSLALDLAHGFSTHASTRAFLQQLPPDCLQALGRMCHPELASRASLEEAAGLEFVQQRLGQLTMLSSARDTAYAAARQQLINTLRDIPGITLAARPSRHSTNNSSSGGAGDGGYGSACGSGSRASWSQLKADAADEAPPPGAFQRLPRGMNAAREAATAAAAGKATAAGAGAAAHEQAASISQDYRHRQQQQEQEHEFPAGSGPPGFTHRLRQASKPHHTEAVAEHRHSSSTITTTITLPQGSTAALGSSAFCSEVNRCRQEERETHAESWQAPPPGFSSCPPPVLRASGGAARRDSSCTFRPDSVTTACKIIAPLASALSRHGQVSTNNTNSTTQHSASCQTAHHPLAFGPGR